MTKKNFIVLSLVLVALPFVATGQADFSDLENALGFNDQVNDVPESPINGLIALGMAVASYIGYRKFKK